MIRYVNALIKRSVTASSAVVGSHDVDTINLPAIAIDLALACDDCPCRKPHLAGG
jgi:hypothetical protein